MAFVPNNKNNKVKRVSKTPPTVPSSPGGAHRPPTVQRHAGTALNAVAKKKKAAGAKKTKAKKKKSAKDPVVTIKKSDLVSQMTDQCGLTKSDTEAALNAFLQVVQEKVITSKADLLEHVSKGPPGLQRSSQNVCGG